MITVCLLILVLLLASNVSLREEGVDTTGGVCVHVCVQAQFIVFFWSYLYDRTIAQLMA